MWWRFNNKEQENTKEENKKNDDKKVVHDIVNETYDFDDNCENNEDKKESENNEDKKESENNEDKKGSFFGFLNNNKDNKDDQEEEHGNKVKIPDCENLLKTMRECTKKNDGTFNCKKEIDEWEKNCKKSWF